MKTLAQIDATRLAATTKASDVSRQLALAGFAVLWIVRDGPSAIISTELARPALLFGLSLALDMFQYAIASFIWVVFYNRQYEINNADESKVVDIPASLNYPAYISFWLKISAVLFGWAFLADYLIAKWKFFQHLGT